MLVDSQIRAALAAGDIVLDPDDGVDSRIQPASVDVRLGDHFATFQKHSCGVVDPKRDSTHYWDMHAASHEDGFVVAPGELVLATTWEHLGLADTMLARVEGKSSLGRLGVLVHATAGYIDPGWQLAPITLEISVVLPVPVKLYPGMPIAQLAFERVEPVSVPYSGKYTGQEGPTPSRFHQNWSGTRWFT